MLRIFILTMLLIPLSVFSQTFEVISTTSLRAKPSSKSTILARVKSGDKGDVLSKEEWWTNVNFSGQEGYIKTATLRFFPIPDRVEKAELESKGNNLEVLRTEELVIENKPMANNIELLNAQNVIRQQKKSLDSMSVVHQKLAVELERTKATLREKESELFHQKIGKDSVQAVLDDTEKLLTEARKKEALNSLPNENQKKITRTSYEQPSFKKMLEISGGITILIEENAQEISNGANLEIKYSQVFPKGFGFEAGLNVLTISELEGFDPFINPFIGLSFGRYDRNIGFSISPRAYLFTNPTLKIEDQNGGSTLSTKLTPSFMYGGGANIKFKINPKLALNIYGSYMRSEVKLVETRIQNGENINTNSENTINIIGTGLGISIKL